MSLQNDLTTLLTSQQQKELLNYSSMLQRDAFAPERDAPPTQSDAFAQDERTTPTQSDAFASEWADAPPDYDLYAAWQSDVPPPSDADAPPEPEQPFVYYAPDTPAVPAVAPYIPAEAPPTPTDADAPPEAPTGADADALAQAPARKRTKKPAKKTAGTGDGEGESNKDESGKGERENQRAEDDQNDDAPRFCKDPNWLILKKSGNEINTKCFVEQFAAQRGLQCIMGSFYAGDDAVRDDTIKKQIYDAVIPHISISAQRINSIFALLAIQTAAEAPPVQANEACFENCTLVLAEKARAGLEPRPYGLSSEPPAAIVGEGFHPLPQGCSSEPPAAPPTIILKKQPPKPICLCRIPHALNTTVGEPVQFLAFLQQLFRPDDIPTVQQFLGYCLCPSTKVQKALFIIGQGGEGKSRLTWLMKQVLGKKCVVSNVSRIGERFFGTMLEHRLLFIDDDLCCEKFKATDTFKTIITNETETLVEPKGKAHYEAHPYARFLLMGNQSVGSLHDRSEGFYRRVHIINTKPRDKTRHHNPNIIEEIWAAEQQEILLWLVKGWLQLARQNYQLTESEASRAALKALKQSDNSALEFLQEQTFLYGEGYTLTSNQLVAKYRNWCYDNDMFRMGGAAFKQTCDAYLEKGGAQYKKSVPSATGRVRGYMGVALGY